MGIGGWHSRADRLGVGAGGRTREVQAKGERRQVVHRLGGEDVGRTQVELGAADEPETLVEPHCVREQ